jgi:hypothetical protein
VGAQVKRARAARAGLLGALAAVGLSGCAGARVEPLGEGLYGIVTHDPISVTRARDSALGRAEAYCRAQGGLPVPVASANRSGAAVPDVQRAVHDLVFRCVGPGLPAGDGELTPEQALVRLREASP